MGFDYSSGEGLSWEARLLMLLVLVVFLLVLRVLVRIVAHVIGLSADADRDRNDE